MLKCMLRGQQNIAISSIDDLCDILINIFTMEAPYAAQVIPKIRQYMYFQNGSLPDLNSTSSVETRNLGFNSPNYDHIQKVQCRKQVMC